MIDVVFTAIAYSFAFSFYLGFTQHAHDFYRIHFSFTSLVFISRNQGGKRMEVASSTKGGDGADRSINFSNSGQTRIERFKRSDLRVHDWEQATKKPFLFSSKEDSKKDGKGRKQEGQQKGQ
jgi:hypothetical protein